MDFGSLFDNCCFFLIFYCSVNYHPFLREPFYGFKCILINFCIQLVALMINKEGAVIHLAGQPECK